MIIYKSCIRCSGDLHLERDTDGAYFNCLQCGFYRDIPTRQDPHLVHAIAVEFPTARAI